MTRSLARAAVAAVIASAALALTACAAIPAPGIDPSGIWGDATPGAREPYLALSGDGSVSGSDGCNRLLGSWKGDGNPVTFGPLASTRMACPDVDTWLSGAATAKVEGSTLLVYDADQNKIGELKRSSGGTTTPTSTTDAIAPRAGDTNPVLTGSWGPNDQSTPHLNFSADGSVGGSDGCNVIGGHFVLKEGVVTFGQMVSTLIACENVDTWLSKAATATVTGTTMTVYDSSSTEIGTLERTS